MIRHVIRKEFLHNIITFRFLVGTMICIIFMILVDAALLSEYSTKIEAYNREIRENEEHLNTRYTYSSISPTILKPPEVLSILSEGTSRRLGGTIDVTRNDIPYDTESYVLDNPFLNVFQSIDIILVFKLVMSLLALLFAFDMFSGEKEAGTLKLTLSGQTSRASLFIGKYFGGLMSLTLALLISFIISILIFLFYPSVQMNGEILLRIVFIFLISIIFVASFFSIGSLISSLTLRSVTSLTFALLAWVVLVIALPNLGDYMAKQLKRTKPYREVETEIENIQQNFQREAMNYFRENPEGDHAVISGTTDHRRGYYQFSISTKSYMAWWDKFIPWSEKKRREMAEEVYAVRRSYIDKLIEKGKFVNYFTIFNPVRIYEIISNILARTSMYDHQNFMNQARRYRNQMLQYFDDNDVYHKYRFLTIMERGEAPDLSSASGSVFEDGSEADIIWEAAREKINYGNRDFLNLKDFPRFHYKSVSLSKSIYKLLPLFGVLVFIILVLILITFFLFVKYDVR